MNISTSAWSALLLIVQLDFNPSMDSPPPIPSTSRAGISASSNDAIAAAAAAAAMSELELLSATALSQVQTTLATELYGFSPMAFTSRIVDLANDVMYNVVDKVEVAALERWAGEGSATTTAETLEDRKQRVLKVRKQVTD